MAVFHHFCSIRWILWVSIARRWRNSSQRRRPPEAEFLSSAGTVLPPQRAIAEASHEVAVRRKFGIAQPRHQWFGPLADRDNSVGRSHHSPIALGKPKLCLPRTGQFNIHLGQNLGVKKRAVFSAT